MNPNDSQDKKGNITEQKIVNLFRHTQPNMVFNLLSQTSYEGGGENKIFLAGSVILRGGLIIVKGAYNKLTISGNCRLRNLRIEIFGNNNTIEIGESVMVYEKGWLCIEGNNCMISIGRKTTIGSADIFCGESDTTIQIGEDCMFSRDIRMNTSDFHSIISLDTNLRINPPANIRIGHHVWVGNGSTLLKGATIGENSIIASRALVTGRVFQNRAIIAGFPAKVIRDNVTWSRDKLPYNHSN